MTPQEKGRLGGLQAAHNMTPEQRERRALKAGLACLEKNGKVQYVRMNMARNGKLPKKEAASQQK